MNQITVKMDLLRRRLMLVVALLATGGVITTTKAQHPGSPSSTDWLINLPASPLKISLAPRGEAVMIESLSTGNIIRFKLGCVARQKNTFSVVEELTGKSIDLPAGIYRGPGDIDPTLIFFPVSEFRSGKARCEKRGTKLAAVEVEFDDGSIWQAKR